MVSRLREEDRLRIESVTRFEDLEPHAAAWDQLLLEAPYPTPSLSSPWILSFLEHQLPASHRWLCLLAHEGDRLEGLFPVAVAPHPLLGRRAPILSAPHGPHLFSAGPLIRGGREAQVLAAFHEELLRLFPGQVVLALSRIDRRNPALAATEAFERRGRWVAVWDGAAYYLPVTGQFDPYMESLGGESRRSFLRSERALSREGELSFATARGAGIADHDLDRFYALEAAGWKGERGSAILSDSPRHAFYAALTRRLRRRGWLELAFLGRGGADLAAVFALRLAGTLTLWKIGFDPGAARHSPGSVLLTRMIREAFADPEIAEVDCLTDAAWLRRWRMPARDTFNLSVFPRRPAGILLGEAPARLGIALRALPGARRAAARLREFCGARTQGAAGPSTRKRSS